MRHVVIIGSKGQLGTDLQPALKEYRITGLTHADLDVCDLERAREVLGGLKPDVVINTSAYHKVDVCEDEPGASFAVNASGAYGLARLAAELDFTLVHFSSDYVFSGFEGTPRRETHLPAPISVYGASKLAGETLARAYAPRHYVIRTTGLYGVAGASGKGGNFVETMLRFAREGRPIRVVDDQITSPTYTLDLADVLLDVIAQEVRGTLHVTSAGRCSWYEFAGEVFDMLGLHPDFAAISTAEARDAAKRPAYSVLDNSRLEQLGLEQPREWREALADYLRLKGRLAA